VAQNGHFELQTCHYILARNFENIYFTRMSTSAEQNKRAENNKITNLTMNRVSMTKQETPSNDSNILQSARLIFQILPP